MRAFYHAYLNYLEILKMRIHFAIFLFLGQAGKKIKEKFILIIFYSQQKMRFYIECIRIYAPFGSLSRKKEKKDKKNNSQPGPGSYDISLPIIAPVVQTIRKRNNNVIVKLGHIGTSAFLGNDDRFKEDKNRLKVGPGQYQSNSDEKKKDHLRLERRYAADKIKQLIPRQLERSPSISQIKRVQFDDEIQMPNNDQAIKKRLKQSASRGSVWSRMTEERIPNHQKSNSLVGPGAYDLPAPQKNRIPSKKIQSSSFVSGSVRSFFDQIIFQTNHDEKARKRADMKYKSDMVGPGSYEVGPLRERKVSKYQFFGSTEERM